MHIGQGVLSWDDYRLKLTNSMDNDLDADRLEPSSVRHGTHIPTRSQA